ncbi:MAG: serine/threonine-protein kinase [Polyangiales bacterium]
MKDAALGCPECGEHFPHSFTHCPREGARLGKLDACCGRRLGDRYLLHCGIGMGAMGAVYAARDERLNRPVAVKLINADLGRRDTVFERFVQEVKTLSLLRHEHIVEVYDFHGDGRQPYFVMEYLRGEDLESLLRRTGRLELSQVARIVDQCCRALAAAHGKDIVHRDLKPANVFLVCREGCTDYVKLLDFGVAKMMRAEGTPLTRLGETWGTPMYMSPEQAEGLPTDDRSDEYALGVMMFEMLSGHVPFGGESHLTIMQQHVEAPPRTFESVRPGIGIPAVVEGVVRRALEKRPSDRYPSVSNLCAALRDAVRVVQAAELHRTFRAYNMLEPSAEVRRALAVADRETFALLESLRHTLSIAHQAANDAHADDIAVLERRVAQLEAENLALKARRRG